MAQSGQGFKWMGHWDWSGGLQNAGTNLLTQDPSTVTDGRNMDLRDGGLSVRKGEEFVGTALSGSTIRSIHQVRFPTPQQGYLIVHASSGGTEKLYASTDALPVSGATFTEIYDLGSGAGEVEVAPLNNRAIITYGSYPLTFAGGLDGFMTTTSGDWSVPMYAIATFDSGVNYQNIGLQVLDSDSGTTYDIGGMLPGSGWIDVCCDLPLVSGIYVETTDFNTTAQTIRVLGYSGGFVSGAGWEDKTSGFTRAGSLRYSGGTFPCQYHIHNLKPGFWYRILPSSGLSSGTTINRILFKGPCQPTKVIGQDTSDNCLGFVFWQYSNGYSGKARDGSVDVIDGTQPTGLALYDTGVTDSKGMISGAASTAFNPASDRLYVGGLTRFEMVEAQVMQTFANTSGVGLACEYFNGVTWQPLSITDGTASPVGVSFAVNGLISFTPPTAWRMCHPISQNYPEGYWLRFRLSSGALSIPTVISEVRIYPTPEPIKKYQHVCTMRDRVIYSNRSDMESQIDVARAWEEFGTIGKDSWSSLIGGGDAIVATAGGFNQAWICKPEEIYILNGYNPETFAVERAETGGKGPINQKSLIFAPYADADGSVKQGFAFLSHRGAYFFTGLQINELSHEVNWWREDASPRLDLDYLYLSNGVLWPERAELLWLVPMIFSGSSQTTLNAIIRYSLITRHFLPIYEMSLSCLATAYGRNENAPGKIGTLNLYGGDYSGRILRLFGPDADTDLGTTISGYVETPWTPYQEPETQKLIRNFHVFGQADSGDVDFKYGVDGASGYTAAAETYSVSGASGVAFKDCQKSDDIRARFIRYRVGMNGPGSIYGWQAAVYGLRSLKGGADSE